VLKAFTLLLYLVYTPKGAHSTHWQDNIGKVNYMCGRGKRKEKLVKIDCLHAPAEAYDVEIHLVWD
jgi:hypothetical protein